MLCIQQGKVTMLINYKDIYQHDKELCSHFVIKVINISWPLYKGNFIVPYNSFYAGKFLENKSQDLLLCKFPRMLIFKKNSNQHHFIADIRNQ